MASVYTGTPAYIPTEQEIAAACDEIQARRAADWDASHPLDARERARRRSRKRHARLKAERANRELQQSDESEPIDADHRDPRQTEQWLPVPTADEPQEMTREDIANVEFINSSDLDSIFDSLIESVSFQHALEDCECRWNIADVDTDLMDLSEPTLAIHDRLALDADERGTPQEMSKADRCNVDVDSLLMLNIVPNRLSDRCSLGDVDPETMDIGPDSLAAIQAATHQPIPMALKTETQRDVVAFRSKRR